MTDYLAPLPEAAVAAWYRRLADRIAQERVGGREPLASIFLRHWLDNRDPTSRFQFVPPLYLQQSSYVTTVQQFHRAVFLTERRARFTGGRESWAGVVPRLQDGRWNGTDPLNMEYESLVEVGNGILDLVRIQRSGTPEERDLLTSLRGFQLKSRVTVSGTRPAGSARVRVAFGAWTCQATDRYDWDYSEHFTVPNPDFGSRQPGAVRPTDASLTVYHSNAGRLERAHLAAPYDVVSDTWSVTNPALLAPAEVDPARRL